MGSGPSLEVTGKTAADPATQRRQEHLWQNAERFAAGQPFQQEYGYGSQMVPGLTGMSQTGQQYLADKILGKGAYGYQSLGFQDYRRPVDAPQSNFQYGQSGYAPGQYFQPGYQAGRLRTGAPPEGGDASMAWGGGVYTAGDGIGRDEGDGGGDLTDDELEALGQFDIDEITGVKRYIQPGEWARRAQYGTTPYEPDGYTVATPDEITATTSKAGEKEWQEAQYGSEGYPGPWDPWGPGYREGLNPAIDQNIWNVEGRSNPYYNQPAFGLQNVPDATSAAAYAARGGDPTDIGYTPSTGGGLLQTDLGRPTAGVGIGEIEDARTATRRMLLEQGRTRGLDYDRFLPGTGGEATDKGYVPPGWEGISKAQYDQFLPGAAAVPGVGDEPGTPAIPRGLEGIDTAEGYADFLKGYTDDKGVVQPADWYGLGPAAGTEAFLPGAGKPTDATGYVPSGWEGLGQAGYEKYLPGTPAVPPGKGGEPATPAVPAGWLGIAGAEGVGTFLPKQAAVGTPGDDDYVPAYTAGWHGLGEAGTGVAPTAAQTGIAALEPWQTVSYDPETGERIVDEGTFRPEYEEVTADALVPGTGETREAYSATDIPSIYKDLSPEQLSELGYTPAQISDKGFYGEGKPDAFTGASFLGGPAGFTPQTVTETDAEGNVTTRQTTPIEAYMDAGGVGAQVTAAQLDYARAQNEEQARRAESKAWGTRGDIPRAEQETAMLARIAEIRRKGYTDAADRMEADLQRQQAAGMQTQQLGTNAMMQMQQLESQRQQAAADRLQQSGLAGQQLGAEALMQQQRLGVGADQRTAELGLQAALANQQAALQTGSQSAQLEADRRMQQAQIDLQRTQQTQQLGAGAAAQQTELEFARRQGLASMGQEAAQQQVQNEFARRQGLAEMGSQAAQQQVQNEFARRQALATMGQDAATQQTALEFQRRQALAGMGQEAAVQQTALEAQRRSQLAEMGLASAQQQTQNEFLRRQGLAQMGLQAQGMGMDDQARFRQQQMQAAQQLAGIGGMEQAATFGAAGQLGAMGQAQQQARQQQAIADYEQWLRGQEGGAEELAMLQAMQPMAQMQQYQRKPSMFGQIAGGLLGAAGTVGSFMNPVG